MPKGDHLGEFEHLVLLAILLDQGRAYGVTIRQEIERRTGRQVILGQVYASLDRLGRKRFVTSDVTDADPVPGGRARRVYSVTPSGRAAVVAAQDMLDRMREGLILVPPADAGRKA